MNILKSRIIQRCAPAYKKLDSFTHWPSELYKILSFSELRMAILPMAVTVACTCLLWTKKKTKQNKKRKQRKRKNNMRATSLMKVLNINCIIMKLYKWNVVTKKTGKIGLTIKIRFVWQILFFIFLFICVKYHLQCVLLPLTLRNFAAAIITFFTEKSNVTLKLHQTTTATPTTAHTKY